MALADITINDGQASPVAQTFSFVGTDKSGRVVRRNLARSPDLPQTLTIGHQSQKQNGVATDAHLWKLDDARMDADGVTVRYAGVTLTVRCDPNIYSDALADDQAAFVRNYFTAANMRLLMKGSVG